MVAWRALMAAGSCLAALGGHASPLTITLAEPPRPEAGYFSMGTARSATGHVLTLDSRSLRRDGQPWMPAMGEFHFARYPAAEWREELLKMKAGGIEIVATYVFWIHHEEIEGHWNWSGPRDLRRFVETARDVGLYVIVRCGPWCHGEVRNGGLPEWLVERKEIKARSTEAAFLAQVRELYGQIGVQLHGLLWKEGGPVIGIQLDNEYRGPAAYLLALQEIARSAGLDVPLYTRTGWPALTSPMPRGAIVPLYGAYAEGFWDRDLTSMPGRYWAAFQFSALRTDAAIATEMLGKSAAKDPEDATQYPYLTCEIGGGMMSSYHRRIRIDPRDVEATTLVKIGSGSTLPGYYMYHGGTNPEGERTTLMEAQDTLTTNYNDLPVKSYDFQAPLGEFGQVRPHYHLLRRLHSFLHDYGADLAGMGTALPDQRPAGADDETTLRWSARSDGRRGFVFLNNYQRGRTLPPKPGVQFALGLADGTALTFPEEPVTIPSNAVGWWPFNLNLGGATLTYATALPFCHVVEANGTRTVFFAELPGVPAEFALAADQVVRIESDAQVSQNSSRILIRNARPSRGIAFRLLAKSGAVVQGVLLSQADSLAVWKGPLAERQRIVLTTAPIVFEGDHIRGRTAETGEPTIALFPVPAELMIDGSAVTGAPDGLFRRYRLPRASSCVVLPAQSVRPPGALRSIPIGKGKQGVAMAPKDADFAGAAVWRVKVPAKLDPATRPLLRFNYVGDVARILDGDRLVTDDFYNGNPKEVGLWRDDLAGRGEITFALLPLQKDAPIFLADAKPEFGDRAAVAELRSVELVETAPFTVTARPGPEPILPANFRTDATVPVRQGL